jgi:glycosylphosphatidylinositol transamidase (GPIT) subunit GPI8
VFKELLKDLEGEEVSLIKTKSGDEWNDVLIDEVQVDFVYLIGDGFKGVLKIDSIESITVEDVYEDEEKEVN